MHSVRSIGSEVGVGIVAVHRVEVDVGVGWVRVKAPIARATRWDPNSQIKNSERVVSTKVDVGRNVVPHGHLVRVVGFV